MKLGPRGFRVVSGVPPSFHALMGTRAVCEHCRPFLEIGEAGLHLRLQSLTRGEGGSPAPAWRTRSEWEGTDMASLSATSTGIQVPGKWYATHVLDSLAEGV